MGNHGAPGILTHTHMTLQEIITQLESLADPEFLKGFSRYKIPDEVAYGIRLPHLRTIAKTCKKDHALALELWAYGKHETRLLASMIADPKQCTKSEMNQWVTAIYSWDVCDQLCTNYWVHTDFWYEQAQSWVHREEEYVKRAGFVLLVTGLIKRKKEPDAVFRPCLKWLEEEANDSRNFVQKALNWLLRELGKRRPNLRPEVFALAERLAASDQASTRWIGQNALNEFRVKGLNE